jgi:sugar phosphate isomerase/epimerase
MFKLAAFADEISPQLSEQIAHCRAHGVTHIELRAVAGKNVLDFEAALRAEIKQQLADHGLGVIAIGSPIGKVKLDAPWTPHFDRFKIAVDAAEYFGAPFIRVFSYFPAEGTTRAQLVQQGRDEVLRRFQAKIEYLTGRAPVLVHENEARIYGETGAECLDLLQTLNSPKLRAAFDFANFVQAGEDTLANWRLLKPFTAHFHVKDARRADRKVVPAGHGDGQIAAILQDAWASGYRGFLSLEPHLGGPSPESFQVAADALKQLCRAHGLPLAGAGAMPAQ